MTAFHTIAIPHDDILAGRLTMDIFAADLWEVFQGRGPGEYRVPAQFFQKTYQTEGLTNLLDVVHRRLQDHGGDPVLQIQTPFGGGKTHALIAMYHQAAMWESKRVVIVGTAMSPTNTLWGVIEEQLTGQKSAFAGMVAPGREALRTLLLHHQPVLILMDEVLEYVTKAAGVVVGGSTLAAQSLAFIQELTELVGTLDQVSLVVTLPSSVVEHYDEQAERLFQQLQRIAGRVEKIYTPVQEHEITSVIRRRLFSSVDEQQAAQVVSDFMAYAVRESLLPAGMEPSDYRQRFEAAYPFMPEVVDVLYERWGSLPTFQRTRGVLRLLALVVYSLKERPLPYISLADFDLADQEIRRELLKHAGNEFDSVIAADITAPDAGSRRVNIELGKAYQGLHLGSRVATSIFLYSFSGGIERGANLGEIKRNATTLGNPSSVVAEAVEQLKGQLFYLQEHGGKYSFTSQPNLNRILLTRMENVSQQNLREVEHELLKRKVTGKHLAVFIWPEQSGDISDTPELKLLLFPAADETLMRTFLEQKGSTPRVNRNTLFFLAPATIERIAFETLMRRYLAYQMLRGDTSLSLTSEQRKEIEANFKRVEVDLGEAVRRVYRRLFVPSRDGVKEQDLGIPTYGEAKTLNDEVYDKLRLDGEILESIAPIVIKERYLSDRDWVYTEQLYQAGLRTPGETRATSRSAWEVGIAEGVRKGLFGLGELEGDLPRYRYFNEMPSVSLTGHEIIIKAAICQAQIAEQSAQFKYQMSQLQGDNRVISDVGGGSPPHVIPIGDVSSPLIWEDKAGLGMKIPTHAGLRLRFTVPKGRVSSLMGIMNLLQSRFNRMEVTLSVEDGQLSEQDYEDKIKEAFRQMGVEVIEEK